MFSKEKKPENIIIGIVGNVDSGKTTLVENIKNILIKNKEPGGITQKIGLYNLKFKNLNIILLDNPGHKLFRKNINISYKIADIIILLISGTDKYNTYTKKILKKKDKRFFFVVNKIDEKNFCMKTIENILLKYKINIYDEEQKKKIFFTSLIKKENVVKIISEITNCFLNEKKIMNCKKGFYVTNFYFEKQVGFLTCGVCINETIKKGYYGFYKKKVLGKIKKISFIDDNNFKKRNPCVITGFKIPIKIGNRIEFRPDKLNYKKKDILKENEKKCFFKKIKKKKKVIIISYDKNILDTAKKMFKKYKNFCIIREKVGQILSSDISLLETFNDVIMITFVKKPIIHERIYNLKTIYELEDIIKKSKKKKKIYGQIKIIKIFRKKTSIIYGCKILKGKIYKNKNILYKKKKIKIKEIKINNVSHDSIDSKKTVFFGLLLNDKVNISVNSILKII
ncbi:GTP-binding protein [Candidatus Vidania fulgoroideorum]